MTLTLAWWSIACWHAAVALASATGAGSSALWSNTILVEEVKDVLVGLDVGVLEVETMACTLDNVCIKLAGVLEILRRLSWDALEASWGSKAVTTTEWDITLTSDDEDRALDWVWCTVGATDGEQLADGHWLAGHGRELEDLWVEVAWCEKVGVDSGLSLTGKVAILVLGESWVEVGKAEVTAW